MENKVNVTDFYHQWKEIPSLSQTKFFKRVNYIANGIKRQSNIQQDLKASTLMQNM